MPAARWTFVAVLAAARLAGASVVLPHSGYLLDASDAPITNPALSMSFALHASDAGGAAVWTGSCAPAVKAGYFTVALGGGCGPALTNAEVPAGEDRYLEIAIGPTTLSPRTRVARAPAAAIAADAQRLGGFTLAQLGAELTNLNAGAISGGTVAAARLPASVAYVDANQTFTGTNAFANLAATGSITLPIAGPRTTCAAGEEGRLYFNSADKLVYRCDGANWQAVGGGVAGARPSLTWTPSALDFGTASVASVDRTATLSNDGQAGATGLSIVPSGVFTLQSTTCAATLAAGANCSATFRLTPVAPGGTRTGAGMVFSATGGPAVALTAIVSAPNGSTQALAATSCAAIETAYPALASGPYWVDPDGGDTTNAFRVWCDLANHNGGWTLVFNLDTSDTATRDWTDTSFWTLNNTVGNVASPLVGDFKGESFTKVAAATQIMMVLHDAGVQKATAVYDLLPAYRNQPFSFFMGLSNITLTTVRSANTGSVLPGGLRVAGDAFADNTHPLIVNSTYSPFDSANYTRLGTNYADRCSTIDCNGHNFGGWGGQHVRTTWGALYEGAQLNGYCATQGAFGTNGRAYSGLNNAFAGVSSGCTAGTDRSAAVDLQVYVR